MSTQFIPLSGCLASATSMQTALAASMLHLFKSTFVPDPSTPLASYTAAEADYDSYVALEMTTWNDPILAPGTGFMVQSPEVQFSTGTTDPTTPNTIGGCYLVDAAGHLRITVIFTAAVPMQVAYQGIPINLVYLFPTGL